MNFPNGQDFEPYYNALAPVIDELKALLQDRPVYVIRHGQSGANKMNRYGGCGWDGSITPHYVGDGGKSGESGARTAGQAISILMNNSPEHAYRFAHTGMNRTIDTFDYMTEGMEPSPTAEVLTELEERYWADLTGAFKGPVVKKYVHHAPYDAAPIMQELPDVVKAALTNNPPGDDFNTDRREDVNREPESLFAFHQRTLTALRDYLRDIPADAVPIIVAHKGTIQAIAKYCTGVNFPEPANGVIHEVTYDAEAGFEMNILQLNQARNALDIKGLGEFIAQQTRQHGG